MKNLVYDLLNGLSVNDLYLFFVQLFASLLLGQVIRMTSRKSWNNNSSSYIFIILPTVITLLVSVTKNSAPLSIVLVGIFLLVGNISQGFSLRNKIIILLLSIEAFACATGFVLLTVILFCGIIAPVVYFTDKLNQE